MAYSYISDQKVERIKNGDYTESMYAYVSEDCDTNFRLYLEHNCFYSNVYNSTYGENNNKTSLINTTYGEVIWIRENFKANPNDGKIYLMFYPNPNLENTFTQGYILFAGLRIHEGTEIYRPSYNNKIHGIYSIPNSNKIYENKIEFDDFIEY